MPRVASEPSPVRRLGLGDALLIGLGSMVGAGVFVAIAPAAQAAGAALLIGLLIAAVVAFGNATSSAQLAAAYPTSGGTYVYGRERLGPWWGYLAGWSFIVGKTASCAAMALTVAAYAVPPDWQRPVAATTVALLVGIDYLGVHRTAQATRLIVAFVLVVLGVVVLAGLTTGLPAAVSVGTDASSAGVYGVLQSAGLLFFAFAGYARIATMGEEVRTPERTIPLAITLALAIAVVVYAVVAVVALGTLGPAAVADSSAPLADTVEASTWQWALPLVRVGAVAAAAGALIALLAGVGRTTLAMARDAELPRWLAGVHPRFHVPHRAMVTVGAIVIVLVLTTDLRGAIGFSSFGVLLYYAIANLSALSQPASQRRYPRVLAIVGVAGCLLLVVTLPLTAVVAGLVVLAVGVGYRLLSRANRLRR